MNIFGVGLPEMAVIMTLALLVFGPKKLPEIGRSMGKAIRGFQEASKEFENEFKKEAERIEKTVSEPKKEPQSEPMKATLEPPELKALASADLDAGYETEDQPEANPEEAIAPVDHG
ncbi:MAG: TatA/E family twin arginine-targeting protein translocase [Drouetiella hepatica Uher 2000/2452]|jgi:sec-independent protein translocase protein TatA|uniref:Sec-independent protein translocase protein TatA n=1 Tax=Drouetiella hepatica Uher 2000/2452 TaxID=904376 RepID=A0A951QEH7_9CYAN|nr:TatA/E family twin arginine-targeting protein translocase [Drouetiella hepatica Uher 2000/2452]